MKILVITEHDTPYPEYRIERWRKAGHFVRARCGHCAPGGYDALIKSWKAQGGDTIWIESTNSIMGAMPPGSGRRAA